MTDLEFEILNVVYMAPMNTMDKIKLTNKFLKKINDASELIESLISSGYLEQDYGSSFVKLSNDRLADYLLEKERRKKRADNDAKTEKEQRLNKKLLILSIVIPSAVGILDILVNVIVYLLSD